MKQKKLVTFRLLSPNPKNTANQKVAGGFNPNSTFPSRTITYVEDEDGEPIQREIMYAPGERSIYCDEQSNLASRGPKIQFIDGFKVLHPRERLLIDYMRKAPWNNAVVDKPEGKESIWVELDYDKMADEAWEKSKLAGTAELKFWELTANDGVLLRAIARKLAVDVDDPLWRNATLHYMRQDPAKFMKIVENDDQVDYAKRLDLIYEAEDQEILMFSRGRWIWGHKNSSVVLAIPSGKSNERHDYLCNWTFTKSDGKIVWKEIEALLNQNPIDEKAVAAGETTRREVSKINNTSYEELFDMCKEEGMLKWNAEKSQYFYHADGGETYDVGKSRKAVITRMKDQDNSSWFEEIKRRLIMKSKE